MNIHSLNIKGYIKVIRHWLFIFCGFRIVANAYNVVMVKSFDKDTDIGNHICKPIFSGVKSEFPAKIDLKYTVAGFFSSPVYIFSSEIHTIVREYIGESDIIVHGDQ